MSKAPDNSLHKRAAVLWTGGKDSALALTLARRKFDIRLLATFAPSNHADFKAHPLALMQSQAESLDIEHRVFIVDKPYRDGYRHALQQIADGGVSTVITGDIAPVEGYPNWIVECSQGIVDTYLPLWEIDRHTLLSTLETNNIKAVVSLAYRRYFAECITGRAIDRSLIAELNELSQHGVDPCGENGEYHSSVLDAPGFRWALTLDNPGIEKTEDYWRLSWDSVSRQIDSDSSSEQSPQ